MRLMVPGIDVSAWQPKVDFTKVAKAGYRFVFVKATEGLKYVSPTFGKQWTGAREAGLIRGVYHFWRLVDARAQAEHFARTWDLQPEATDAPGVLPPTLDFEGHKAIAGVAPDLLVDNALACARRIEELFGRRPILYTGPNFWKRVSVAKHAQELLVYPLWEASPWKGEARKMPWPVGRGGKHWTFWQHSHTGKVPGVRGNCDLNQFAGDEAELRALAGLA